MEIFVSTIGAPYFFLTGLFFGSFFNVLIHRMPRDESVISPPSHCPKCNHRIRPWENIPLLSYLFLRGRCSSCKISISIRYPLVELFTGLAALLCWYMIFIPFYESSPQWWEYIYVGMQIASLIVLIPISLIDIDHYIIPDELSLGGFFLAILTIFIPGNITPLEGLYGFLAGAGVLFSIGWIGEKALKKEAMGFGDVKLMAFLGTLWGWTYSVQTIIYASFLGSVIGGIQYLIYKESKIPFGPYLAGGLWIAALFGDSIFHWYLQTLMPPQ